MSKALTFLKVKNNMYYSFLNNVKRKWVWNKKNKRGELILLKDEASKLQKNESNKKIKYFFHALPSGSMRTKGENDDVFVSFSELSTAKEVEKPHIQSSKKKPTPYGLDCYNFSNDARNNK